MEVLVTGATGFIGRATVAHLVRQGHRITALSRDPSRGQKSLGPDVVTIGWRRFLAEQPRYDAVINLMGESIAARHWTKKQKNEILVSRRDRSQQLLDHLASGARLTALVSASAIGYYPCSPTETFDEDSPAGEGFLAQVVKAWEYPISRYTASDSTHILRFGNVLGAGGGIISKIMPLYRLGLTGLLGPSDRWVSWIQLLDVVRLISWALCRRTPGPLILNAVSPQPVLARQFEEAIRAHISNPLRLPVPSSLFKFALGEMSELLLGSQKVVSKRLVELGFVMHCRTIEESMQAILGSVGQEVSN